MGTSEISSGLIGFSIVALPTLAAIVLLAVTFQRDTFANVALVGLFGSLAIAFVVGP